jgi:predicted deacylase
MPPEFIGVRPFLRPPIVSALDIAQLEPAVVHRLRVVMTENATGNETMVPAVVMRARDAEPVVGVTAAVHGNELNGIPVIHRLVDEIPPDSLLRGTLIAVPIVNVPGYLRKQREFEDGADLNRIMPGRSGGNESEFYAHRFVDRIARHFQYSIDLHTASSGRVNSLYVRADMNNPVTAELARLISPQIILHSPGADGTLRSALADMGIQSVTVEVGDPQRLQRGLVRSARLGVQEVLQHLGMIPDTSDPDEGEIVECTRSYWMYTDRGGVLNVLPSVVDRVEKDELVARLFNVWGDVVREYRAPESGVVVGKSTDPAARAGSRILHLGIVGSLS